MLRTNNKAVRLFFAVRYYLIGTLVLAFIIYDTLDDKYNFLLILFLTALGSRGVLGMTVSSIKRTRAAKRAAK